MRSREGPSPGASSPFSRILEVALDWREKRQGRPLTSLDLAGEWGVGVIHRRFPSPRAGTLSAWNPFPVLRTAIGYSRLPGLELAWTPAPPSTQDSALGPPLPPAHPLRQELEWGTSC